MSSRVSQWEQRQLVLAGGGGAADSRPLDEVFAEWIGGGRLLYLPLALQDERHPAAAAWLRSTFEPLGVSHIESWSALDGHNARELFDFDGVYIGGGNAYRLLHQVRTSGFDRAITRFIHEGGPVYGGSAGAILLGRDIDTALLAGDSNDVRLRSTRGLDVLCGWSVMCHYRVHDLERTRAFTLDRGLRAFALSERAGITLDRDGTRSQGSDAVVALDGAHVTHYRPGSTIPLASRRGTHTPLG
jgi:dipeptidase E